jgi:hypothetical protein
MPKVDSRLTFACWAENDLYRALGDAGQLYPRYTEAKEAIAGASAGGAVLCLADSYPSPCVDVDESLLALAAAKRLRLYVEYPSVVAGLELGEPRLAEYERLVVASDFFAPSLERHAILAQHGCWLRPTQVADSLLVAARVAGYRRALYGLPAETFPILFQLPGRSPLPGREVLVATSKLSGFVTGRYGPAADWKVLWESLLRWLSRSGHALSLVWQPAVGPTAGPEEALPDAAESLAFARSVRWFREHAVFSVDAKKGAIEGFESPIDHTGRQLPRASVRADCTAETALVFACEAAASGSPASRRLTVQMLDYAWSSPDFLQSDPASPSYGLVNWYDRVPAFYGDDNARVVLATLAAARVLDDDRWDERVLRCLLANLRTTGRLGFRRNRIDLADFAPDRRGWEAFRDESVISLSPHFQAYLWASYLWAYSLTGYEGFLQPTLSAIRMTMDAYPRWEWTNGLTQELARMLLPLAQLLRVADSPEHRAWLDRIAGDLLANMRPSGAIQETLGALADGRYPSPRGNEGFGSGEASIIQENGDPACDLLYTANYAFLGLREAASVTGDRGLKGSLSSAEDRLADFLCRVQVRSAAQPYLDGAWMRSFDFDLWEYWGSSADLGWGAWSVESGWTNSWIAAVLAFRRLGTTILGEGISQRRAARLRGLLPDLLAEMR